MAKPIRELDGLLRHPGFEGTPASPRQLEWLLHRSCSLGLPAPLTLGAAEDAQWERDDLDEFTDPVTWTAVPYGRTIVVRGEANGVDNQRHVCVLSVGLRPVPSTGKPRRHLRSKTSSRPGCRV